MYNVRYVVMDVIKFPVNLKTTSGLSILLHGVISLPDAKSYDTPYIPPSFFSLFFGGWGWSGY